MFKLRIKLNRLRNLCKIRLRPKKLLVVSSIFAILVVFYLLISFLSIKPIEIKLARLKNSWEKEKICHEACSLKRQTLAKAIVDALEKEEEGEESRLRRRIKLYFLNETLNIDFRLELVRIIRQVDGSDNPPDYFQNYLSATVGNAALQAEIISSFSALSLFPENPEHSPLDYYFTLLAGDYPLDIKQATIRALSNCSDKTLYFSLGQIILIRNLVLDPTLDRQLRPALVMLLGDYYPLFPAATIEALSIIYKTKSFNDPISQAFAADILNRNNEKNKLPLPDISDQEWNEYYNN